MTVLISDSDVRKHLSMPECIGAMHTCFKDFAEGMAVNRPRVRYLADTSVPGRKFFANVHVGAVPSARMACVRAGAVTVRPPTDENPVRTYDNPRPFNWGVVILFDLDTAEPVALMHEFFLSGLRVGATTGLAVDKIARPEAKILGLFGTGKQALTNCEAILAVRNIQRVQVYSPNREHRENFSHRLNLPREGIEVVPLEGPEAVLNGADIVCCASNIADGHLFDGNLLKPGQMVVTIVNSDVTRKRSEVDEITFARASHIVLNDWESVIDNGQTELLEPMKKGLVSDDQIVLLGDIVAGRTEVRQTDDNLVYYKNNTGLAIQFAAAGRIIYDKVLHEGTNRTIPTEWLGTDLSAYQTAGFSPSM